ncbi:cytochrome C oxidase subunit IV family protein [Mycobacterium syngnathidarum]
MTIIRTRAIGDSPAILYAWAGLTAATLLSFWLGSDQGISSAAMRNAVLLVVAFIKIHFIGRYFMDLKTAPAWLRRLFDWHCVALCLLLVNVYILVGST